MRPRTSPRLWMGVAALFLLHAVPGAAAQLTEHCTVSVLNRNVQANPDGSWVLPNVPANFGQVRARATCVDNGVTTAGESAFFTLPANGVVNLPDIVLGATTQIPVSLNITPGPVSFTAAAQTSQLTVTATYPDGSTQNVTAGTTGTTYTTSNPALVTVSPDGLTIAVASGTVVIQATHDGAAGLTTATVRLSSTDSDGDGIPDDVELALGLNPNNPTDAQEDFDRDGLTNLQEYQRGTNIRIADTDSDGLSDGDEATRGTNPLLADTDGDGIRDGLEVQTGSNPLDPTSFNLAQALTSMEVIPATFVITVNTIIGEASRQLTVTGHLKDGTTINLTSAAKQTNYTSSNLNVCNFSAQDGQVFGGADGTCAITVTNNGFTATALGTVRTFSPAALSFVSLPGSTTNVDVSGNFAYVAAGSAGLHIVNVADRHTPTLVASFDTPGNANDVRVVGTTAFIADGSAGLRIIDVTDPLHPQGLGALDTPGTAQHLAVQGSIAFVADGTAGLRLISVTNLNTPTLLSTIALPGGAQGVDANIQNHLAVVAAGASGIHVIDITNPAAPALLGSVSTGSAQEVALDANAQFAFVADLNSSFTAVDLSDPRHPVVRATTPPSTGGRLVDVALAGRFALGADIFFVNGVPIIDVSTPATPVPRTILNFSQFGDDNGTGIAADITFVYLTTDRSRLLIGQYLQIEDTAGIPPTVAITAPLSGDTLIEGQTVTVHAQATDDIAVASVSFLVDGQVRFTDTAAPFEFMLVIPTGTTSMTFRAQAIDFGSNVATTQDVVVNVIPDPGTTVVGRVIDINGNPVAGATVTCLGVSGLTRTDGTFSIAAVPTIQGDIRCTITFIASDGRTLTGSTTGIPPVIGGTTDVGVTTAIEAAFETAIGNLVAQCDDCSVQRPLPFPFPFFGQTYTSIFVNNNGNLTFTSAEGDFTETISEFARQPRISSFWDDLINGGLYVNNQLPGRFVVTWFHQQEFCCVGDSTIQATLFADGRIQFAYNGVTALDAIVGITPGGAAPVLQVNYATTASLSTTGPTTILEQFTTASPNGSTDPTGSGQGAEHRFNLDRGFILFIPNASGGYDVRVLRP